ncbi:MAG: hypothetical protein HYR96_01960 [Deltaproteobacteria bacterium]|nr:hypothetical protein [Deltaproteobacteria bacterium]MBI3295634.1 hypothetical protein [Deltaproteobacteria bacterium]
MKTAAFLGLFWVSFAFGLTSAEMAPYLALRMNEWADDFTFDNERFAGNWGDSREWKGFFCQGRSSYRGLVGGKIRDIDFKLRDGYIEVVGDLKDIWGRLEGSYRSKLSACVTVSAATGLSSDLGHFVVFTYLNAPEVESPVKSLEVRETVFGRLHFGLWLPNYLEEHLTTLVNAALVRVWSGQVGAWINRRISKEIGCPPTDGLRGRSSMSIYL